MFRKLSFLNIGPDGENQDKNWRILDEGTKAKQFAPTLTSTTGTITPSYCVATLMGPWVYVLYELSVPNLAGFTTSTTLELPYTAYNSNGTLLIPAVFDVTIKSTGAVINTTYLNNTTTLKFGADYTNNSGATVIVNIQGSYFRD